MTGALDHKKLDLFDFQDLRCDPLSSLCVADVVSRCEPFLADDILSSFTCLLSTLAQHFQRFQSSDQAKYIRIVTRLLQSTRVPAGLTKPCVQVMQTRPPLHDGVWRTSAISLFEALPLADPGTRLEVWWTLYEHAGQLRLNPGLDLAMVTFILTPIPARLSPAVIASVLPSETICRWQEQAGGIGPVHWNVLNVLNRSHSKKRKRHSVQDEARRLLCESCPDFVSNGGLLLDLKECVQKWVESHS